MIELQPSIKVKQLRQAIKDELGIKEKVNVKLYLMRAGGEEEKKKEDKEEVKEGDELLETLGDLLEEGTGMVIITDDKLTLQAAGIVDRANKLEVEIVIRVSIDVQGKGKDYSAVLDVSPEAVILTTLQARLNFFKTFFQQRRMQLYIVPSAKGADESAATPVLINDLHKTFKEWDIKEDGVSLQLREPGKKGGSYT